MLTPLPTIPTDSYYKFKAMAGIWLVVAALVGEAVAFYKFQNEVFNLLLRGAALRAEGRAIRARLQDDSRMVAEAEDQVKELKREGADVTHALSEPERLINTDSGSRKNSNEVQIAAIKEKRQLQNEFAKRIDAKLEVVDKRLDDRRESAAALDKDTSQLGVIGDHTATLGRGMTIIVLIGFLMSIVGVFLAWSGLSEWRDIQKAQDAFLRRQWSVAQGPGVDPTDASSSTPAT